MNPELLPDNITKQILKAIENQSFQDVIKLLQANPNLSLPLITPENYEIIKALFQSINKVNKENFCLIQICFELLDYENLYRYLVFQHNFFHNLEKIIPETLFSDFEEFIVEKILHFTVDSPEVRFELLSYLFKHGDENTWKRCNNVIPDLKEKIFSIRNEFPAKLELDITGVDLVYLAKNRKIQALIETMRPAEKWNGLYNNVISVDKLIQKLQTWFEFYISEKQEDYITLTIPFKTNSLENEIEQYYFQSKKTFEYAIKSIEKTATSIIICLSLQECIFLENLYQWIDLTAKNTSEKPNDNFIDILLKYSISSSSIEEQIDMIMTSGLVFLFDKLPTLSPEHLAEIFTHVVKPEVMKNPILSYERLFSYVLNSKDKYNIKIKKENIFDIYYSYFYFMVNPLYESSRNPILNLPFSIEQRLYLYGAYHDQRNLTDETESRLKQMEPKAVEEIIDNLLRFSATSSNQFALRLILQELNPDLVKKYMADGRRNQINLQPCENYFKYKALTPLHIFGNRRLNLYNEKPIFCIKQKNLKNFMKAVYPLIAFGGLQIGIEIKNLSEGDLDILLTCQASQGYFLPKMLFQYLNLMEKYLLELDNEFLQSYYLFLHIKHFVLTNLFNDHATKEVIKKWVSEHEEILDIRQGLFPFPNGKTLFHGNFSYYVPLVWNNLDFAMHLVSTYPEKYKVDRNNENNLNLQVIRGSRDLTIENQYKLIFNLLMYVNNALTGTYSILGKKISVSLDILSNCPQNQRRLLTSIIKKYKIPINPLDNDLFVYIDTYVEPVIPDHNKADLKPYNLMLVHHEVIFDMIANGLIDKAIERAKEQKPFDLWCQTSRGIRFFNNLFQLFSVSSKKDISLLIEACRRIGNEYITLFLKTKFSVNYYLSTVLKKNSQVKKFVAYLITDILPLVQDNLEITFDMLKFIFKKGDDNTWELCHQTIPNIDNLRLNRNYVLENKYAVSYDLSCYDMLLIHGNNNIITTVKSLPPFLNTKGLLNHPINAEKVISYLRANLSLACESDDNVTYIVIPINKIEDNFKKANQKLFQRCEINYAKKNITITVKNNDILDKRKFIKWLPAYLAIADLTQAALKEAKLVKLYESIKQHNANKKTDLNDKVNLIRKIMESGVFSFLTLFKQFTAENLNQVFELLHHKKIMDLDLFSNQYIIFLVKELINKYSIPDDKKQRISENLIKLRYQYQNIFEKYRIQSPAKDKSLRQVFPSDPIIILNSLLLNQINDVLMFSIGESDPLEREKIIFDEEFWGLAIPHYKRNPHIASYRLYSQYNYTKDLKPLLLKFSLFPLIPIQYFFELYRVFQDYNKVIFDDESLSIFLFCNENRLTFYLGLFDPLIKNAFLQYSITKINPENVIIAFNFGLAFVALRNDLHAHFHLIDNYFLTLAKNDFKPYYEFLLKKACLFSKAPCCFHDPFVSLIKTHPEVLKEINILTLNVIYSNLKQPFSDLFIQALRYKLLPLATYLLEEHKDLITYFPSNYDVEWISYVLYLCKHNTEAKFKFILLVLTYFTGSLDLKIQMKAQFFKLDYDLIETCPENSFKLLVTIIENNRITLSNDATALLNKRIDACSPPAISVPEPVILPVIERAVSPILLSKIESPKQSTQNVTTTAPSAEVPIVKVVPNPIIEPKSIKPVEVTKSKVKNPISQRKKSPPKSPPKTELFPPIQKSTQVPKRQSPQQGLLATSAAFFYSMPIQTMQFNNQIKLAKTKYDLIHVIIEQHEPGTDRWNIIFPGTSQRPLSFHFKQLGQLFLRLHRLEMENRLLNKADFKFEPRLLALVQNDETDDRSHITAKYSDKTIIHLHYETLINYLYKPDLEDNFALHDINYIVML